MASSPSDDNNVDTNAQEQPQPWLMGQSFAHDGYGNHPYYPTVGQGQPPQVHREQQHSQFKVHHPPPQQMEQQQQQQQMMMMRAPNYLNENIRHDVHGDSRLEIMARMHPHDNWQPQPPPPPLTSTTTAAAIHTSRQEPLLQNPSYYANNINDYNSAVLTQHRHHHHQNNRSDAVIINASHQEQRHSSRPFPNCFSASAAHPPLAARDADPVPVSVPTTASNIIQARCSPNFMQMMEYSLPRGNINDAMKINHTTTTTTAGSNANNYDTANVAAQSTFLSSSSSSSSMIPPAIVGVVQYPTRLTPLETAAPSINHFHDTSDYQNMATSVPIMGQGLSDEPEKYNIMPPIHYPNQPHLNLPPTTPVEMLSYYHNHHHHHHHTHNLHPLVTSNKDNTLQTSLTNTSSASSDYTKIIMNIGDSMNRLSSSSGENDIISNNNNNNIHTNTDINNINKQPNGLLPTSRTTPSFYSNSILGSSSNNISSRDGVFLPPPPSSTVPVVVNTFQALPVVASTISSPSPSDGKCVGAVLQPPQPSSSPRMNSLANTTFQPSSGSTIDNNSMIPKNEPMAVLLSSMFCSPVGLLQPPPPPLTTTTITTSLPVLNTASSSQTLPIKKDMPITSLGSNHQPVVTPSQGEGGQQISEVETTSHDYLRSLLRSKKNRSTSEVTSSSAQSCSAATPFSAPSRAVNTTTSPPIQEISIPSTFSPTHSYRAMAAYSLLRTLSKELRLSPFTFQAFTTALMLPVPSKLLGEVHVRLLRLLFAAAAADENASPGGDGKNNMLGQYFYDKFGDGGGVDLIQRRTRTVARKSAATATVSSNAIAGVGIRRYKNGDETERINNEKIKHGNDDKTRVITDSQFAVDVVEYGDDDEFVPKKGGNNLSFLDQATWPLYYQDYALATERSLLNIFDTNGIIASELDENKKASLARGWKRAGVDYDNDEFIDMRSVAMLPTEDINLYPSTIPKFDDDDDDDNDAYEEEVSKRGPASYSTTNFTENASRCPVGPFGRRNQLGRFVCCPFHILAAVQMYRNMMTPASTPIFTSSGSENSKALATMTTSTDGVLNNRSKARKSNKHERKVRQKSPAKIKNLVDDETDNDDDDDTDDDDYKPFVKNDNKTCRVTRSNGTDSPRVRGSRVYNIEVASSRKTTRACDPPVSSHSLHGVTGWEKPQCQASMTLKQEHTTKSATVSQSSNIQQTLNHNQLVVKATDRSFPPIVVPEVQHLRLPDEKALVVSRKIEEALDRLFSTPPSASGSNEVEIIHSNHSSRETILTERWHNRPGKACNDNILAHMVPVHHLERGIPHHHLCLDDKLTILEFLLDELLQVPEIALEMSRRQDHTSQLSSLYGAIPSPRDYEEMENSDECKICGVEGQLLCCDGCPGSFHRSCIGIANNAKLPEGKWLCPECKIVDASKMAPLDSDMRPLMKWFTLSELGWPFHRILDGVANDHCIIPSGVEFLVTSGLVFARYRANLAPFDPLHISASPSIPVLHSLSPPSPLDPRQLAELLKLLGPQLCSFMPWLRIPFTPQKLFSSYLTLRNEEITTGGESAPQTSNPTIQNDKYLRFLIYYQDTRKEFLANHPDLNNPMVYINGYNRAPPIPLIQNHQGVHMMVSSPHNYPAETSALSVAILDMTIHRDQNLCLPYIDPIQSIRNSIIQLEQTLGNACLLNFSWCTNRNAACWRRTVHNTNSITKLGSLLVNLIDACDIVAFVSQWYTPKECSSPEIANTDSTKWVSILPDEWTSKRESIRRKWERCRGNDILRLHKGTLCPSLKKRGKIKMTTDVSIDAVRADAESTDNRGENDSNSFSLSTSRRRSDRFSTTRQQIETILGVSGMELSDKEKDIVELKLDKLERIVVEVDDVSINWPIAGKTLFEPNGSLPRPMVRRLARNAGSARAPSVTYDTAYDVGETALCHRWRKITNKCTTYECLLQCLRFVNAHINKTTIMAATTAANRTTSSVKEIIRCVHTDPCTGFKEYFVTPVNRKGGHWCSEQKVNITSLVHHRSEQRKLFVQHARVHDVKSDAPAQSGKKRETSPRSVDAKDGSTKKSKIEGANQVDNRLQLVIDKHREDMVRLMHESATKGEKSVSTELLEDHRSNNLIVMRHANLLVYQEGGEMLEEFELKKLLLEAEKEGKKQTFSERRRTLNEKKRALQSIVDSHRGEILKLMKEMSLRGEPVVGNKLIEDARSKKLVELRLANGLVGQVGGKMLTECELQSRMTKAEEQAVRVCELEGMEGIRKEKERDFRSAVDRHRDVIVCLFKECSTRGESNVNSTLLANARSQNLVAIRAANQLVHEAGGKLLTEVELKFHLTKAEEAASKMYRSDAKRLASTNSALSEPPRKRMKEMRAVIEEKKLEFEAAIDKHKMDTLLLMKACALKGEAGVSSEDMTAARNRNFIALEIANQSISKAGGTMLVDIELKIRIARAEKEAVDMYIRDLHPNS